MTGDLAFKVTNSTKEEMGMTIEGFFFSFLELFVVTEAPSLNLFVT